MNGKMVLVLLVVLGCKTPDKYIPPEAGAGEEGGVPGGEPDGAVIKLDASSVTADAPFGDATAGTDGSGRAGSAVDGAAGLSADAAAGGLDGPDAGPGATGRAALTADPPVINFGQAEVGVATPTRTWTITNTGDAASGALSLRNDDPGHLLAMHTCSATLPPGGKCVVTVSFKPAVRGTAQRTLIATANPGGEVSLTVTAESAARLTVVKEGTGTVTSEPAGINCGATCSALIEGAGAVTLRARTTDGSGHYFSGWSYDGCKGPGANCDVTVTAATSIKATFSPLSKNLVFVTSTKVPTNLGSVAAYDAKCNEIASAAGLNDTGGAGFVAAISDMGSPVSARLGTARGWVRMDGKPFADTQLALFTKNQAFNSIRFDEHGTDLKGVTTLTGAEFDETTATLKFASGTFTACNNWTNSTGMGMVGSSEGGAFVWQSYEWTSCAPASLVCMGKTKVAPVAPAVASGRLLWTTNTVYVPGSQTPNSKCMAERPPGVSSAAALIATTTKAASALIDPGATYLRPDGTLVGTGAQLLAGGQLESGIWQSADGNYATSNLAWSGSRELGALGTLENTCNDWTTSAAAAGAIAGGIGLASARWWYFGGINCDRRFMKLYCIQTP